MPTGTRRSAAAAASARPRGTGDDRGAARTRATRGPPPPDREERDHDELREQPDAEEGPEHRPVPPALAPHVQEEDRDDRPGHDHRHRDRRLQLPHHEEREERQHPPTAAGLCGEEQERERDGAAADQGHGEDGDAPAPREPLDRLVGPDLGRRIVEVPEAQAPWGVVDDAVAGVGIGALRKGDEERPVGADHLGVRVEAQRAGHAPHRPRRRDRDQDEAAAHERRPRRPGEPDHEQRPGHLELEEVLAAGSDRVPPPQHRRHHEGEREHHGADVASQQFRRRSNAQGGRGGRARGRWVLHEDAQLRFAISSRDRQVDR